MLLSTAVAELAPGEVSIRTDAGIKLYQAQSYERMGRASAGIAHDFNNYLTGIVGIILEVQENLGASNPQSEILEIAMKAALKAGALSKRLLSSSRETGAPRQLVNLNNVITGMGPLLKRLVGDDIDLQFVLTEPLEFIEGDPNQMEQVILNLVLNARDAMPAGGQLTIETDNVNFEVSRLGGHSAVKMAVRDTGCGMDTATLKRIFEPFFTTKDANHGTGIGLAALKSIVEDHHGDVSVASEPHRGSQFTVLLRRAPHPVSSQDNADFVSGAVIAEQDRRPTAHGFSVNFN